MHKQTKGQAVRALLILLMSQVALAQTVITNDGDYIEVPPGKDVVFIKAGLPKQCAVICTSPVMHPEIEPQVVECEDGVLVISPSVCTPKDED
jgi:hypothetical protein